MSFDPIDQHGGKPVDAATLLAEASGAATRAERLRCEAVSDMFISDAARLDDRRRAGVRTLLRAIVGTIGADIHDFAARRLTEEEHGASVALARVEASQIMPAVERQLQMDVEVAADLIDRVTLDLIGEALPNGLVEGAVDPWIGAGRSVERAAEALRQAESRRRTPPDQPPYATDLPAEAQVHFTWWIAAAMASAARPPLIDDVVALDRAIADGAAYALAQADEGERLEAAAVRLAATADLRGGKLSQAIDHCLAERRIVLLAAMIARAAAIDYDSVRRLLIDPADPRLWLVLRSLDLPRESLARLGYGLAEADHRRDIERFADRLDAIMHLSTADAGLAIAVLRLPPAFRQGGSL